MKNKKVGRNDPCPCGSGKKFKKCCNTKISKEKKYSLDDAQPMLPLYDNINYGPPILDSAFFKLNNVHEISAPRLVYSCLLNPEVEKIASMYSARFINRGAEESTIIENTENVDNLIDLMRKGVDSLNQQKLINKLVLYKENSLPLILIELKKPHRSQFVELAVKIIHSSQINCSNEIMEILQDFQIGAYSASLLCMLLGFSDAKESEKLLWNYYNYFKEHFPNETYSDGPLLGLLEMREREKEKLAFYHKRTLET